MTCLRMIYPALPRGGAITVDLLGPDGTALGRADVDLASLQLRPTRGAARALWCRWGHMPHAHSPPHMSEDAAAVQLKKRGSETRFLTR